MNLGRIVLGACLIAGAEWDDVRAQALADSSVIHLQASELYVQFFPLDKVVRIREYGLRTALSDEEEIRSQAGELQSLIARATYCQTRYGLEGFKSGQETLFSVRHTQTGDIAVHAECMLVTSADMPSSMNTVFGNLLGREVSIAGAGGGISLVFDAIGLDVGPTNAEIRENNDTDQIMLLWAPGERFFEAVFILRRATPSEPSRAIDSYLPSLPVSSPALDREQVEQLRNSL